MWKYKVNSSVNHLKWNPVSVTWKLNMYVVIRHNIS